MFYTPTSIVDPLIICFVCFIVSSVGTFWYFTMDCSVHHCDMQIEGQILGISAVVCAISLYLILICPNCRNSAHPESPPQIPPGTSIVVQAEIDAALARLQ